MSDRSFVRAGGYAGILLAISAWLAVVVYYTVGPSSGGLALFEGLYALIAFWSLVGVAAAYYRTRDSGQAWAAFGTLVGVIAAIGSIVASVYEVARLLGGEKALSTINPANPLGIMTFGLTGIWFAVTAALMLRMAWVPRLLAVLGFVAFADLEVGFIASVAGIASLSTLAALIAGAVGGPIFWLWLGVLLLREG